MRAEADRRIDELEYRIQALKSELAALRRNRAPEEVADYPFRSGDGAPVRLSGLFGERDRLILVHNMGRDCPYCTMWADGFAGLLPHLESRAAFVVTTPDPPEAMREFAASRGWPFAMYSAAGTSFIDDMGFLHETEGLMPGVSVFSREEDGAIRRVARAEFGPGDDFCAVWHLFELFPEGVDGWEPRFAYAEAPVHAHAAAGGCHG